MTVNADSSQLPHVPQPEDVRTTVIRRLLVPLTILAWAAVIGLIFWVASHIIRSLLLLIIAALIAYALAPAVRFLRRFLPRFLAVLIVYLIVFMAIGVFVYIVTRTAVRQTVEFAHDIPGYINPGQPGSPSPLEQALGNFGISPTQIQAARQQITGQVGGAARDAIPILREIFSTTLDTILVAVISIYLMLDGARIANWIRRNAPQPARANFLLDTLQNVIGGYIRGQLLLAVLIGILVWLGMTLFRLPYAVFLGVLAFIMAFIPIIGTFISGAICVLIGLTHGWPIALGVLVYFIGIHIFEGDLVGPRIVGKAVGLHPVVSLFALAAGAELFGVWGALFASPVAGVAQALLITFWTSWRRAHPEQFRHVQEQATSAAEHGTDTVTTNDEPPHR
jgi:predicted PurR-regulated permease PerM